MSGILIQSGDAAPQQNAVKSRSGSQIVSSDAGHIQPRSTLVRTSFGLEEAIAQPSRRIAAQPGISTGSLAYLAFVALVAVGTIVIVFGTGLSLLMPPQRSGGPEAA